VLIFGPKRRAVVSPLPQYAFMAWCLGKQIPFMAWYLVKHMNTLPLHLMTLQYEPQLNVPGNSKCRPPSRGIKRPKREADHSLPSIAEVNAWRYASTPP